VHGRDAVLCCVVASNMLATGSNGSCYRRHLAGLTLVKTNIMIFEFIKIKNKLVKVTVVFAVGTLAYAVLDSCNSETPRGEHATAGLTINSIVLTSSGNEPTHERDVNSQIASKLESNTTLC
jgi:hypothetical protein